MGKNKKNLKMFYFRILKYFIFLTVPIIIISIVLYYYNRYLLRNEFTEKIALNLENMVDSIGEDIRIAQRASMEFYFDEVVTDMFVPSQFQKSEHKINIGKISNALSRNKNVAGELVDNVFVYNDCNIIYAFDSSYGFREFFNKWYQYDQYDIDFWEEQMIEFSFYKILKPSKVKHYTTQYSCSTKYVLPIMVVMDMNGYKTVMVNNISCKELALRLEKNALFHSTQYFILDKYNNDLLENVRQNDLGISPDEIISMFDYNGEKNLKIKLNNQQYVISYLYSERYDWRYLSVTPTEEFKKSSSKIFNVMFLLCGVFIIVSIILAFYFSHNLYNPIKAIRDKIIDFQDDKKRVVVEDGLKIDNEMKIIENGLTNLIKIGEEYKKISKKYLDSIFQNLIKGTGINDYTFIKLILNEDLGFRKEEYLCLTLLLEYKDDLHRDICQHAMTPLSIQYKMKSVFWGVIEKYLPCYSIGNNNVISVLIINVRNENEIDLLYKALKEIEQLTIYDRQYYDIIIGLGKVCHNISDIKVSYNEAIVAIDSRTAESGFQILDAANIDISNQYFYSQQDKNKLISLITTGGTEGIEEEIKRVVQRNRGNHVLHNKMVELFIEMFQTVRSIIKENKYNLTAEWNNLEIEELRDVFNYQYEYNYRIKTISEYFIGIANNVCRYMKSSEENYATKAVKYINENYNQELNLDRIADESVTSPKYISRIFKKKMGINITQYIAAYRMSIAKDLLVNSNKKIGEISQMVGISSRATFLRLFKKEVGVTPNEYRKINTN